MVINNEESDQSDHDSDQEEDSEPPTYQVDYDSNTIGDDICTAYTCVRKDITAEYQDPMHLKG